MRTYALFGMLMLAVSSPALSMADDHEPCTGGHDCKPKTKSECFNLVCYYNDDKDDNHHGFKNCKVASTFTKDVTKDGGEVSDDSNYKDNPAFEVTCDGVMLFNNSARRFTDLLGTRIQGESGPHPAITLPRGELHSGSDGTSGNHVSPSALELDVGNKVQRMKGKCFIWTGTP